MKYVIMCGGLYEQWETPKQLQVINGEKIVERTIRLLLENEINKKDIAISSNDERFDDFGVKRLEHNNSYRYENRVLNGYWLDAFYPKFKRNQKVTFLFGDVYYSEDAINKIINAPGAGNILYGSKGALTPGKVWGEPFAYVVNDLGSFYDGIKAVKQLQDEGKTNRVPLVWELYRYLNGIDVNVHQVKEETYFVIDDETNDADTPAKLERIKENVEIKHTIFTVLSLNAIGGGESFLYYLAKKYKDRDITVYYKKGNIKQLNRLRKYVKVVQYTGQKIKCKRAIFNYDLAFINTIQADEYIQLIHCDYKANNLTPKPAPYPIKYIAVSKAAADSFKSQTGKTAEVIYNPIVIDKKIRILSATRLNKENKGQERIEKLANILEENGVNYHWDVFTNDNVKINALNVECHKSILGVTALAPAYDFFCQLSSDEAYCYSVVEALSYGAPCIVTNCPVFNEIGLNDTNSIILDFDLSNVPIDKIKKGLGRVKNYKPPKDKWSDILTGESSYEPEEELIQLEVLKSYDDVEYNKRLEPGTIISVTQMRAKQLLANEHNLVKRIYE